MSDTSDRNPMVTWLLPVRNAMPFLTQALQSIEAQTYPHWRVLAWDNGSTDGSREVLQQWIGSRIPGRLISDRPLALGPCLAEMVKLADTDLCARADGDDINDPARLQLQVEAMLAQPKVGLVGSHMQLVDEDDVDFVDQFAVPQRDAQLRWSLRFRNVIHHPTVLFRRSLVIGCGNYRDVVPEDYDLWLRMAIRTRMINLPQRLVRHRVWTSVFARLHDETQQDQRLRDAAFRNVDLLFPGLSGHEVVSLYDTIRHPDRLNVSLWHAAVLHKAATQAAKASGERAGYFRWTRTYDDQQLNLVTRWIKSQPAVAEELFRLRSVYAAMRDAFTQRKQPTQTATPAKTTTAQPATTYRKAA